MGEAREIEGGSAVFDVMKTALKLCDYNFKTHLRLNSPESTIEQSKARKLIYEVYKTYSFAYERKVHPVLIVDRIKV